MNRATQALRSLSIDEAVAHIQADVRSRSGVLFAFLDARQVPPSLLPDALVRELVENLAATTTLTPEALEALIRDLVAAWKIDGVAFGANAYAAIRELNRAKAQKAGVRHHQDAADLRETVKKQAIEYRKLKPYHRTDGTTRAMAMHLAERLGRPFGTIRHVLRDLAIR